MVMGHRLAVSLFPSPWHDSGCAIHALHMPIPDLQLVSLENWPSHLGVLTSLQVLLGLRNSVAITLYLAVGWLQSGTALDP